MKKTAAILLGLVLVLTAGVSQAAYDRSVYNLRPLTGHDLEMRLGPPVARIKSADGSEKWVFSDYSASPGESYRYYILKGGCVVEQGSETILMEAAPTN